VVHHGLGYGAYIGSASSVQLVDNVFFSFVKRGIEIETSKVTH
jgi:hypothetical protein